ELGMPMPRFSRQEITGPIVFGMMIWAFFVRFSIPVLAVFYGTSLIADEVEDKTITYLFTRPIPRGAVLVGKYLAYLVCTVFVVLPAVVTVWIWRRTSACWRSAWRSTAPSSPWSERSSSVHSCSGWFLSLGGRCWYWPCR